MEVCILNIGTSLKEKGIHFSLIYYGPHDLATGWDIKAIIDNNQFFVDVLSNNKLEGINSKEEYEFYLFCLKISNLLEVIDNITTDENKELVQTCCNLASEAINSIDKGDVIRYIINSYEVLLSSGFENHDIKEITINYICKYASGMPVEVFNYIADEYGYLYVDRFDDFFTTLEENPELFDKVLGTYSFDELRLKKVLAIWKAIKRKKDSSLKDIVDKYNDVLYEWINKRAATATKANIYAVNNDVNAYHEYLHSTKDIKANEFNSVKKRINKMCDEEVYRSGQVFKQSIPVGDIVEHWRESQLGIAKLFFITHNQQINGKRASSLSLHTVKQTIIDLIQSNLKTDGYFTSSHLMKLSGIELVSKATLMGLLHNEDTCQELYSLLLSSIATCFIQTETEEKDFINDINVFLTSLDLINHNKTTEFMENSLNYGFCMYICALLEKILRSVYYNLARQEIYVELDGITLKDMLNDGNVYFKKIFEEDHLRNLRYFLLTDGETRIGKNLRNNLAHLNGISVKDVTFDLSLTLLWLFIDIVNSILLFYMEKNGGQLDFVYYENE